MAADSAVNQATSAATGAFKKVGGCVWNRVNPLKISGLWASLGVSALVIGGGWALAPTIMPAAPVIAQGTSVGANMMSVASYGVNSVCQASAAGVKGIGSIVTHANWGGVGEGLHHAAEALTSSGAGVGTGAETEIINNALPGLAPGYG